MEYGWGISLGQTNLTSASEGICDVFILKLDKEGNFVWARQIGASKEDFVSDIETDDQNNIYTTGYFKGKVDFDPTGGIKNLTATQQYGYDFFIQKLDPKGDLIWVKQMGGSDDDKCAAITLDEMGNIYTTGTFRGTADFNPGFGTASLTANGWEDIFIQKLKTVITVLNEIVPTTNTFLEAKVYPNPSSGLFHVECKNLKGKSMIQVFDQSGKTVLEKQAEQQLTPIDLSKYSAGLYTLRISNTEETIIQRIMIQFL